MAIIEGNPWVSGASGMVMNQIVYRQRAGKTIVSAKPRKCARPASEKQNQHRERFRMASRYAKAAARDSIKGPLYAEQADGFNSAYNIALKDYLGAPVISGFDLDGFSGGKGNRIGIYAEDNFRVAELTVTVLNAAGQVLATGQAEEVIDNTYFSYRLGADLPAGEPLTLRVKAKDYAGNATVCETAIESMEQSRVMPGIQKLFSSFLLVAIMLLTACGGLSGQHGKPVLATGQSLCGRQVEEGSMAFTYPKRTNLSPDPGELTGSTFKAFAPPIPLNQPTPTLLSNYFKVSAQSVNFSRPDDRTTLHEDISIYPYPVPLPPGRLQQR